MRLAECAGFVESFNGTEDFDIKLEHLFAFLAKQGAVQIQFMICDGSNALYEYRDGRLSRREDSGELQDAIVNSGGRNSLTVLFGDVEYRPVPVHAAGSILAWLFVAPAACLVEGADSFLKTLIAGWLGQESCQQENLKKNRELETIKKLSDKVAVSYNLQELMDMVSKYVTKALSSKGSVIRLVNRDGNALERMSEFGLSDVDIRRHPIEMGSGISGEVWQTKRPKLVTPATEDSKQLLSSKLRVSSLISVPLVFENEVIGVLTVYEKLTGQPFDESDSSFLEVIASLVAPIIAYTSILEREKELSGMLEKNLRDMQLITEINKVIMQPRKLDELLYIILTALTFGEEIGFNRAALFMHNSHTGTIQGMMGVGCDSMEEARETWEKLPKNIPAIVWLEQLAIGSSASTSSFGEKIKHLRFNMDESGALFDLMKAGKVTVTSSDQTGILNYDFLAPEYAIVPLAGKRDFLGVIYVDNKFTMKKIEKSSLRLLETFASQTVLAIENAKLYGELRDTNAMLNRAREELVIKEKLATVGEMLTTLAHEIRNPLTAIGGFANIMVKKIEDPNLKTLAAKISNQAGKMDQMFREFLYLTKHSALSRDYCDLNLLVRDCVETFSYDENSKHLFSLNLADSPPPAYIDRSTVEVVLNNLIKNAMQAMPDGGTVTITTGVEQSDAVISVEDEGRGIPVSVLPNLFHPFYTTKFNGVGIGLAISYKIIEQHNGSIYAENRENSGARFVIRLPLENKPEGRDAQ